MIYWTRFLGVAISVIAVIMLQAMYASPNLYFNNINFTREMYLSSLFLLCFFSFLYIVRGRITYSYWVLIGSGFLLAFLSFLQKYIFQVEGAPNINLMVLSITMYPLIYRGLKDNYSGKLVFLIHLVPAAVFLVNRIVFPDLLFIRVVDVFSGADFTSPLFFSSTNTAGAFFAFSAYTVLCSNYGSRAKLILFLLNLGSLLLTSALAPVLVLFVFLWFKFFNRFPATTAFILIFFSIAFLFIYDTLSIYLEYKFASALIKLGQISRLDEYGLNLFTPEFGDQLYYTESSILDILIGFGVAGWVFVGSFIYCFSRVGSPLYFLIVLGILQNSVFFFGSVILLVCLLASSIKTLDKWKSSCVA